MTSGGGGPVPVRTGGEPVNDSKGGKRGEGGTGRLRFGPFELNQPTLELRRDGAVIRLAPQPAKLLALLATRRGEMVSREEIREHVWGSLAVEFDSGLHTCVRHIRSALGDDPQHPRYIETIPRRGYRFIAEVEGVSDAPQRLMERTGVRAAILTAGALLVALALVAVFWRHEALAPAEVPPRLVVLPFASLLADEEHPYLAEGLADEIRTDLARIGTDRLAVIARVSSDRYRDADTSMKQIVADLGVTHLLEGSVRSAPQGLVLSARLVRTDDETQVWADRFEVRRGHHLDPVAEIASQVTSALALELDPNERRPQRPPIPPALPEARDALLEARYLYYNDRSAAAEARLLKAVELAPDYAEAHGLLAELLQASSRSDEAETHAQRAIELDPTLSQGYRVLGHVELKHLKGVAAGRWYEQAVQVAPEDPESLVAYGFWLVIAKRPDEGIALFHQALHRDPVSPLVIGDLPWAYLYAHRLDEADKHAVKGLELLPDLASSRSLRVWLEIARGNDAAAKARVRELMVATGMSEDDLALLDGLSDAESVQTYLERILRLHQERDPRSHFGVAAVHALLGNTAAALTELELAYQLREPNLAYVPIDPRFNAIRSEPRFLALLEQLEALLWRHPAG